jgi:hypothetical protein
LIVFSEENKPTEIFQTVLDEYDQQFSARWLGVMGNDHAPRFVYFLID